MRLKFFTTERKLAAHKANASINWLAELLTGRNSRREKMAFLNLENAPLNSQTEQDLQISDTGEKGLSPCFLPLTINPGNIRRQG